MPAVKKAGSDSGSGSSAETQGSNAIGRSLDQSQQLSSDSAVKMDRHRSGSFVSTVNSEMKRQTVGNLSVPLSNHHSRSKSTDTATSNVNAGLSSSVGSNAASDTIAYSSRIRSDALNNNSAAEPAEFSLSSGPNSLQDGLNDTSIESGSASSPNSKNLQIPGSPPTDDAVSPMTQPRPTLGSMGQGSNKSSKRKLDARRISAASSGQGNSANIFTNIFAPSYNKIVDDFEKLFPPSEYNGNNGILLTNYSCALQTDPGLLEQGKLYVTSQGLFFTSFIRPKFRMFISFDDIEVLKKHLVMVVFPTAILVAKKDGTSTVFASFRTRDKSLALINHYFQCFQKDPFYFENGKQELLWKELNRNYGRKFVPPTKFSDHENQDSGSESENENSSANESASRDRNKATIVEEPELSVSADGDQPEGNAASGGLNGTVELPDVTDAAGSSVGDAKKKSSSSQAEGVLEKTYSFLDVEPLADINSKTLTREEGDDFICQQSIAVPMQNGFAADEDDEDERNEVGLTSSDLEEVQCMCSVHDPKSGWTQYLDNVYYISVDSAFNMLFEKSDFYHQVLKRRKASKFVCGKWKGTGKRERELTYVMPTNSSVPVAPKAVDCTEMQYVDAAECQPKKKYGARAKVKNHNKFSDNFLIHTKYCLTRNSAQRFRLQLFAKLEFTSSWVLMKDLIRDQVDIGLKEHCEALDKALQLKISESKIVPTAGSIGVSRGKHAGPSGTSAGLNEGDLFEKSDSNNNIVGTRRRSQRDSASIRRDRSASVHGLDANGDPPMGIEDGDVLMKGGQGQVSRGGGLLSLLTYHTSRSSTVKTLLIILLLLACVSHALLIYQLSAISTANKSLGATLESFDWSKISANRMPPPFGSSASHSEQGNERGPETCDLTSQQLLAMIVNSHVQQQTQFQQIMKNSLAVLEVMTSNVNSVNLLVASHISEHEQTVKQFREHLKKSSSQTSHKNDAVNVGVDKGKTHGDSSQEQESLNDSNHETKSDTASISNEL